MLCKKGVFRNFAKFTGKLLCQSLFFNKAALKVVTDSLVSTKINQLKMYQCFLADLSCYCESDLYLQAKNSISRCEKPTFDTSQLQKQPPEVFYKKGVLKYFTKFTGKHLCQSFFFKREPQACNFIKKETLAQVFSYRTPPVAASSQIQNFEERMSQR